MLYLLPRMLYPRGYESFSGVFLSPTILRIDRYIISACLIRHSLRGNKIISLRAHIKTVLSFFLISKWIVHPADGKNPGFADVGYPIKNILVILNGFVTKNLTAYIQDSEIIIGRSGFTFEHFVIGPAPRFVAVKYHHDFAKTAGIGSSSPLGKALSR